MVYYARDGETGPRQFQDINNASVCQYVHRGTVVITPQYSMMFGVRISPWRPAIIIQVVYLANPSVCSHSVHHK